MILFYHQQMHNHDEFSHRNMHSSCLLGVDTLGRDTSPQPYYESELIK